MSEQTFNGKTVLIQGVELGVFNVPLHRIYWKLDFITGPVTVDVRPTLSVPGVSFLLGNDLAGGKVVPDPIVCERVTSNVTSDKKNNNHPYRHEYRILLGIKIWSWNFYSYTFLSRRASSISIPNQ